MRTSEQVEKLIPAWHEARKGFKPAGKSGHNTYDNYEYAKEEDWYNAVKPALDANGLVLLMEVHPEIQNLPDRKTRNGGIEYVVQVKGVARLWHTSGQWVEIDGVGQGQDRADKALYKAMTGMKKYLYAMLFALPTSDDAEADHTVGLTPGDDRQEQPPRQEGKGKREGGKRQSPRQEQPLRQEEQEQPPAKPEDRLAKWFDDAKGQLHKLPTVTAPEDGGSLTRKGQLFAWLDKALKDAQNPDESKRWTPERAGKWINRCMEAFALPDFFDGDELMEVNAHATELLTKLSALEQKG